MSNPYPSDPSDPEAFQGWADRSLEEADAYYDRIEGTSTTADPDVQPIVPTDDGGYEAWEQDDTWGSADDGIDIDI